MKLLLSETTVYGRHFHSLVYSLKHVLAFDRHRFERLWHDRRPSTILLGLTLLSLLALMTTQFMSADIFVVLLFLSFLAWYFRQFPFPENLPLFCNMTKMSHVPVHNIAK